MDIRTFILILHLHHSDNPYEQIELRTKLKLH